MKRVLICMLASYCLTLPLFSQRRAINIDDLWSMGRVGEFALSPDGQWIAFTVTYFNMDKNSQNSDIFLANSVGGLARQLTTHQAYDGKPCWSPDGSLLAFISTRESTSQIFEISMEGGEARRMSDIPTGIDDFMWSPDGKYFAFTTRINPDASSLSSSVEIDKQLERTENKTRIIDHLFYRHWNRWLDNRRRHIFVMPSTGGAAWDVTPGNFDAPTISLGSQRDFRFSPDSKEIAFVRNIDANIALSTNNDIFVVPTTGGTIRRITQNPANDNQPVYSPDGMYIAYRAMRRPGYEADQYDLMLYDRNTKESYSLTSGFGLSVGEIVWGPYSEKIYFSSPNQKGVVVYSIEIKNSRTKGVLLDGCNTDISVAPDGESLFFKRSHIDVPHEIYSCGIEGDRCYQVTFMNQSVLDQLEMNSIDDFWYPSFDGKIIHGLLLKPPFFDPAKTYPAILLIHGGPQGAWRDEFHYRWNAQLFASAGYIVIMINFRGSRGYGQDFCDEVRKNWGGGPYQDLMTGLDYAIESYPFIQSNRIAAAGGSYGGFMVNWIAGHTDRFKCLVSHAGITNMVSFYGATEELWFPEWEFEGTPYTNMDQYEKWSPIVHAQNFKTPTLVIHGEQDFRIPVDQGLQMFTALKRQGVPSRLLYFPDEGHFIQKPQNARMWWKTVLEWIDYWIQE